MNKKYLACAIVCLVIGIGIALAAVMGSGLFGKAEPEEAPLAEQPAAGVSEAEPEPAGTPEEAPAESEDGAYVSPIDFDGLWERNPDIFGWLDIPGTEISYPLLQSEEDDTFYLDHDADGNPSAAGALFTESLYNSKDMTDPMTVIYGHHMKSGALFGNLQQTYSDGAGFAEYSEIVIYLPDRELHYTVYAAVPYDNRHIMQSFYFSSERSYNLFLESIRSVRAISAQHNETLEVAYGDRLIALSTCLSGNSNGRYLVVAKLVTDISSPQESVMN